MEGDRWVAVPGWEVENNSWTIFTGVRHRFGTDGKPYYLEKWTYRADVEIDEALVAIHRNMSADVGVGSLLEQLDEEYVFCPFLLESISSLILSKYLTYDYEKEALFDDDSVDRWTNQWLYSFPNYYASVA